MIDFVLYNGKIITLNNKNEVFEAIGIQNGKIIFLGKNDEINTLNPKIKINLNGKPVFPGFIDGHMHLLNLALMTTALKLNKINSIEDLIVLCEKELLNNNYSDSNWLMGRGWSQELFLEKRFLEKNDLDRISKKIPIFCIRCCGHIATVNQVALDKILSLKKSEQFIEYIDIEKGLLKESSVDLCFDAMPEPSINKIEELIKIGQKELLKHGITSVGTDDINSIPGKNRKNIFLAYKNLDEKKELKIRISEQNSIQTIDELKIFLTEEKNDTDFFKNNVFKIFQDGSLGARTANLIEDYSDNSGNKGIQIHSNNELYNLMRLAHNSGMQIAVHCIGDKAAEITLNQFIKLNSESSIKNRRHGIVHTQILNETIIEKMSQNSILAYIQPIFIDSDMDIIYSRIGEKRAKNSYIWLTMKKKGINLIGSTDAPVDSYNIMESIHCAITRDKIDETNESPFLSDEKLTVEDALRLFTSQASFATFEENKKGTLELGKFADMIVLSDNLFEIPENKIKNIQILMTICNGEIVFSKE